jgi:hypothetical protein
VTRKQPATPANATGANLPLAIAMRGKASAAGPHADRRTKRNRTRGAQSRREIGEQFS